MKKYLHLYSTLLILMLSNHLNAQQENRENVKIQYFECRGNNTTILLPADFKGPKYFPYEEGTIIDFYAPADTCVVSVLCGDNGELKLDAGYQITDTQQLAHGRKRISYYNKQKDKYARKGFLEEYVIMYDHANAARKDELDKIFDKMEK